MRRKLLLAILLVLIIGLAIGAGVIFRIAHKGLPQTSGTIGAGVTAPVDIYRDQYGIPHIVATTMEDLFFAQGYAQAQDRLWQMDMSRRGVGGKLSEILGEDYADTDQFVLTVGFYRAAEKNYSLMSASTKTLFEAYASGVNAYIDDNSGNLSPEFTLLGYKPEPWIPQDCLAIGVYMSWYLGGNMQGELFYSALIEEVGLELAAEIFPDYPTYGPIIAPTEAEEENQLGKNDTDALIALSRIAELNGRTRFVPGLGSNNWVISGDLAPGQGAILANDMHLAMGLPSIWHSAHLILEDQFNISGVTFPGVPSIIVGFNDHIAWGLTNTGPDVQDLYRLQFNPDNPHQYLYMDQWINAEVISEQFQVKGEAEPRELEVLITRFGPVISSVVDLETPLSLRWAALDGTSEFEAFLGIMRAKNWDDFTTALENFMSPTQNFVYADREGNIGYRANGLIPIRRNGNGLLPADGTTDQYEWIGYIPWDELPTLYNPEGGIIVTANHRIVDDDYPYFITSSWAPPYRAMSIWRELEERDSLDFEDMIRGQSSFYNSQAATLGATLTLALKNAELSDIENRALGIFETWLQNPVETVDQPGASIYNVLYMAMLENTFTDEMGEELYERFLVNRASSNAFDRMLLSGESIWFNDINTDQQETRDDIIAQAFRDSVAFLAETMGKEPDQWQWGKLHTFTFKHNLGTVALLARFYNRGPYPIGGSFHTPANMSYQMTDPFGVTHSAPWRYMVDMSDHTALEALAGGNSGHPFSDHYDDQLELWLANEYKEMIFEVDAVKELPEKLTLKPY